MFGSGADEDKRFVEKGVQSTFAVMHRRVAAYPVDTAACFGIWVPGGVVAGVVGIERALLKPVSIDRGFVP